MKSLHVVSKQRHILPVQHALPNFSSIPQTFRITVRLKTKSAVHQITMLLLELFCTISAPLDQTHYWSVRGARWQSECLRRDLIHVWLAFLIKRSIVTWTWRVTWNAVGIMLVHFCYVLVGTARRLSPQRSMRTLPKGTPPIATTQIYHASDQTQKILWE